MQKRIESLKKIGDSENIAKEIKDMETLIDEIKEKIDSKVSKLRDHQRLHAILKITEERKEQEPKAI